MSRSNFDLDMVDDYPDALGSRNTKDAPAKTAPVESITPSEPKHVEYEGIEFRDFEKVDLRVGNITEVSDVPGAKKPLYKLTVDLGELGTRTIVAGIGAFYTADELINRQIVVVVNLKPRSLAGIMSYGMLLAAEDESGKVSLVSPDAEVKPGCRLR